MFSSAGTLVGRPRGHAAGRRVALWQVHAIAATEALTALGERAAELYRPAAAALLADVTPVGRRVGTYALYRTAINAGFALGPAMAGFFIARSVGYVFVGDALTSVLYGALVLAAIPRSLDAAHRPRADAAVRGRGPSALRLIAADGAL